MAGNSRDSGRAVTARALSVLTAFDAGHSRQTLTEIARRADIPLATAHRLVGELERWGALQRDRSGNYAVGLRLWELGRLAPVHTDLHRSAAPVMRALVETTGASVRLAIRDGFEAVCVEQLDGRRTSPAAPRTEDRLPLHATGVGMVLLASAPAALVEEYCARAGAGRDGIDTAELGWGLRAVRERGHALVAEDSVAGDRALAVPVRDCGGVVVASLGLGLRAADPEEPPGTGGDSSSLVGQLVSAAESIGRVLDGGLAGGPGSWTGGGERAG